MSEGISMRVIRQYTISKDNFPDWADLAAVGATWSGRRQPFRDNGVWFWALPSGGLGIASRLDATLLAVRHWWPA